MIGKCLAAIILVSGLRADLDYLLYSLVFKADLNYEPLNKLLTGRELSAALIAAIFFVLIYNFLVRRKTIVTGTAYGLVFGLVAGSAVVYIASTSANANLTHAAIRLLADICQGTLAGMITALILKPSQQEEQSHGIAEEV